MSINVILINYLYILVLLETFENATLLNHINTQKIKFKSCGSLF